MACPAADQLGSFVDDRLDEPGRLAVEEHLDECDACRSTVALLVRTGDRDKPGEDPLTETTAASPDALAATVDDAAAHGQTARDKPLSRWSRPGIPVGATLDRYVIGEVLGKGGMGIVYRARDPELDRDVAVKVLRPDFARSDPDAVRRIVHEAKVMARISHPNVLAVFDVGRVDDRVFLTMEMVAAGNLNTWLERTPRLLADILEVFTSAGRGLIAAHGAGVVHRDFKPDNVLIGDDGRVRVTDFGLAHDYAATAAAPEVAGTPRYMAPEQFQGGSIDARTDQFSFCVALYEALYGERPFRGRGYAEVSYAVTRGEIAPPPANSRVPASLRAIVLRGLALAPGDRYPTMADLLKALARDRARAPRQAAFAAGVALIAVAIGLGADWVVRDRTHAVAHEAFAVTRAQLDKSIALRTQAFVAQSEALYVQPALREIAATRDQADFGLGEPTDDRARLERTHEMLASASWATRPGEQLAVGDAKGRLLYNSADPAVWGNTITGVPAIAAAYDASAPTSIGVIRADDPMVIEAGVLGGATRSGLYVVFARVHVESGQPRAAFVQLIPGTKLLDEVAVPTGAERTYLSVVAPDRTIEGSVPAPLARATTDRAISEVAFGGDTWLVQRAPLGAAGQRAAIAEIVLARRANTGLAGLFPRARLVLVIAAGVLAAFAIAALAVARRRDLGRRR